MLGQSRDFAESDMLMSVLAQFQTPPMQETSLSRRGWRLTASHLSYWTAFIFLGSRCLSLLSCPGIFHLLSPSLKHGVRVSAVKSGVSSESGNLRLPEARSRDARGLNPGYTYTAPAQVSDVAFSLPY